MTTLIDMLMLKGKNSRGLTLDNELQAINDCSETTKEGPPS